MNEILLIKENEIISSNNCWDIEVINGIYKISIIKNNQKEIAIEFSLNKLPKKIVFNKLNMSFNKHNITIQDGIFTWNNPQGGKIIQNNTHASFKTLKNSYALEVNDNGSCKLFGT